jgi:hypothetical protein
MVIDTFAKVVDGQDEKGFEKYKMSIDDAQDEKYDWKLMALEEAADLAKYQQREILKLQKQLADYDRCVQKLYESEQSNHWLLDQLLDAKEKMKKLKELSRASKCLQLEAENLAFAKENAKLKELLEQNNISVG